MFTYFKLEKLAPKTVIKFKGICQMYLKNNEREREDGRRKRKRSGRKAQRREGEGERHGTGADREVKREGTHLYRF